MLYELNRKDYRRFLRRMRASDMKPFLKSGCDMGWYGHFVGPVPTPKINSVIERIREDARLKLAFMRKITYGQ